MLISVDNSVHFAGYAASMPHLAVFPCGIWLGSFIVGGLWGVGPTCDG